MKQQYKKYLFDINEWCRKQKTVKINYYANDPLIMCTTNIVDDEAIELVILDYILKEKYLKDSVSSKFQYKNGELIGKIKRRNKIYKKLDLSFTPDPAIKNSYSLDIRRIYNRGSFSFKSILNLKNGIVTNEEKESLLKLENEVNEKYKIFFKKNKGLILHNNSNLVPFNNCNKLILQYGLSQLHSKNIKIKLI